ncbi:MAG: MCE family protein [Acidobacteriota bacterium]|nr:MCE family protein [Acidobacteriota bacterium]
MPSQQEVKWSQLKVGSIVVISSVLLTALLFLMTSAAGIGIFSNRLTFTAYFANSAGLKDGAPVALNGVSIGDVKTVTVVDEPNRHQTPVKVVMKINAKYGTALHQGARAALDSVGILGDTIVDITNPSLTSPLLHDGDEISTSETPSLTDVVKSSQDTMTSMNSALGKLNTMLANMQNGQGSAGQLMTNPALYNQTTAAVTQLNKLIKGLNEGRGSAGKLIADDTMYNRLNDAASKLDAMMTALDEGKGSAGMLLKDYSLYKNLNSTLAHANSLLADADAGKGGLGLMLKDARFRQDLSTTLSNVSTLVGNINAGKGSLGKLATDDQMYTNLNTLMTSSTSLVTAIRQDPKKYLSIKLKIF